MHRTDSPVMLVAAAPKLAAAIAANRGACARDTPRDNAAGAMTWAVQAREDLCAVSCNTRGQSRARRSQPIERTFDAERPAIHDVQVDHRGPDVLMAQELLHGPNVVPIFQQVRGEAVTLMPRAA